MVSNSFAKSLLYRLAAISWWGDWLANAILNCGLSSSCLLLRPH